MKIHTIGFTKKNAKKFFELISKSGAKRVVDVRLNNISQLAGFAKRDDLKFFLEKICGIEYLHEPLLAPTQEMLDEYKKNGGEWSIYEARFYDLMAARAVERRIPKEIIADSCLLCSEDKPHHCHRRIVAEYFRTYYKEDISINHLT